MENKKRELNGGEKDYKTFRLTCFTITAQLSKEQALRCTGPQDLNPRILRLTWQRSGRPQILDEDIVLVGSENNVILNFHLPMTTSIAKGKNTYTVYIVHTTCISNLCSKIS